MKKVLLVIYLFITVFHLRAEEGMLIPSIIQAFESDMKAKGMKLTASDIYNVNQASLKDAIIHFNGGCTAELVSKEGLLLTNHHCGYSQIQSHSSLKNDYLKYGFWAKNKSEELPNVGLTATRIVRIDDVTKTVLEGTLSLTGNLLQAKIKGNIAKYIQENQVQGYKLNVQAFDYGNSYFCMTTEVFEDVRLVGTPPNSIGKFGGDTDNWVWPRHTGDFSVFRIYVGKDNKPAAYHSENVPYTPIKYLKIAAGNRKEGDFTMVYGFPGTTEQHHTSEYIKFIVEKERPARISMREKSLSVIDRSMRASDEVRIKYSAKQASIANAYKKWIGQIGGLKNLDAVGVKQAYEAKYNAMAQTNPEWNTKYGSVISDINKLVKENAQHEFNYAMVIEYLYTGPEFYKQIRNVMDIVNNYEKYKTAGTLNQKLENYSKGLERYFKNYDLSVDQQIFELQHPEFSKSVNFLPKSVSKYTTEQWSKMIFSKSIVLNKVKLENFFKTYNGKSKSILKDPAIQLHNAIFDTFRNEGFADAYFKYSNELEALLKVYSEGKKVMFPNEKHWLDANSTLRVTYGLLEGSSPNDGMRYTEHTTTDGILQKWQTGNPDFELLPDMIELYKKKEFGRYAQDGELWVCFTGSNHTTGGNSGSPVLDKNGNLMGLNFDRTWESTMSDYMFDANRCRNIVVDIRYVLWTMDIYGKAPHLVDEMELVYE